MSRNYEVINSRTRAKKRKLHFLTWMRMTPVFHVSKLRKGSFTGPVLYTARHGIGHTETTRQTCPGSIAVAVIKHPTPGNGGGETDFTFHSRSQSTIAGTSRWREAEATGHMTDERLNTGTSITWHILGPSSRNGAAHRAGSHIK